MLFGATENTLGLVQQFSEVSDKASVGHLCVHCFICTHTIYPACHILTRSLFFDPDGSLACFSYTTGTDY